MSNGGQSIRVATFNLHHGVPAGKRYRGNPELAAQACAGLEADILALQEVDLRVLRSRQADLAGRIARRAGMQFVFAHTMPFMVGLYGNALLVRGDITDCDVVPLGGLRRFKLKLHLGKHATRRIGPIEPRNAILATAHVGDRQVSVAATHLSTERSLSRQQLSVVLAALAERPKPHVLLGDLNLSPRDVRAEPLVADMTLVDGLPTSPASDPKRQIDHIAVRGLSISGSEARRLSLSDHLALVAEIGGTVQ